MSDTDLADLVTQFETAAKDCLRQAHGESVLDENGLAYIAEVLGDGLEVLRAEQQRRALAAGQAQPASPEPTPIRYPLDGSESSCRHNWVDYPEGPAPRWECTRCRMIVTKPQPASAPDVAELSEDERLKVEQIWNSFREGDGMEPEIDRLCELVRQMRVPAPTVSIEALRRALGNLVANEHGSASVRALCFDEARDILAALQRARETGTKK